MWTVVRESRDILLLRLFLISHVVTVFIFPNYLQQEGSKTSEKALNDRAKKKIGRDAR